MRLRNLGWQEKSFFWLAEASLTWPTLTGRRAAQRIKIPTRRWPATRALEDPKTIDSAFQNEVSLFFSSSSAAADAKRFPHRIEPSLDSDMDGVLRI